MINERGSTCLLYSSRVSNLCSSHVENPRRKLNSPTHLDHCKTHSYPSPPMSNPPSPPRFSQDRPASPSREPRMAAAATASTTTALSMPIAAVTSAAHGTPLHTPRTPGPFPHAGTTTATIQTSQTSSAYSYSQSFPAYSSSQTLLAFGSQSTAVSETSTGHQATSVKGGRKSKAHVASACINCKRAHLSCDVNRPCGRCVSSGKQDTCFDVQHKKRGRPRLREEGEFKAERMVPESSMSAASVTTDEVASSSRVMAIPRPRRAESFRSLRSQESDVFRHGGSSSYSYEPSNMMSAGQNRPRYPPGMPDFEIPTAYLDLDLVIIKANQPFCQIMQMNWPNNPGRQLSEIAAPLDGVSFAAIRASLRAERDHQAPAYMPPIVQAGQDFLEGASLYDPDRYTQGSEDHTYTWRQSYEGHAAQSFPARVRLAKTNAYFVAVTLPSFQPAPQAETRTTQLLPHTRFVPPRMESHISDPQYTSSRHQVTQSAPAGIYMPQSTTVPLPAPHRTLGHQPTRSYPPPQPPLPYQQQAQRQSFQQPAQSHGVHNPPTPSVITSRPAPTEPPTETTVFIPRSTPQEPHPSHTHIQQTGIRLPPILGTAPYRAGPYSGGCQPTPGATTSQTPEVTRSGEASADERGSTSRSPRKRRKLDLGDVLH